MKKTTTLFTVLLFVAAVFLSNQTKAQSCHWVKKVGGAYEDGGNAVATDASGNVYALGYYYSSSMAFPSATFTTTLNNIYGAGPYMYLAKYDSCGTLQWAKQAGGNGETNPYGITTDAAGNVYVTGYYNCDTLNFGAVKLINTGGYTAFVTKYNSSGVAQWAQQGVGDATSRAFGITVDGSNNVYITGYFSSTSLTFGSNSVSNGTADGFTNDAFIAKFDNSGNNLWIRGSTSNTSTDGDVHGFGIGTDASGNVYVGGGFESTDITFGSTTLTNNGYNDIFVVKYNASGAFQWLKTAGDVDDDQAFGLAVDAAGNSYIAGRFGGSSTITFGSSTITNAALNPTVLIAKYDANGNPQWANVSKGDYYSFNTGNGISLDAGGNPCIIGIYSSDSLRMGSVTLFNSAILNGGIGGDYIYDVFVAKYKANGTLLWARTAGGDSNDVGNGIAAGLNNSVYITGNYASPTFSISGTTITSANSLGDAFIANNISTSPVTPSICLVSADSIVGGNEYNMIYWDKTPYHNVDRFVIYREVTNGVYAQIGSQPYSALSAFTDTARSINAGGQGSNGDPTTGPQKYKLQILDTAGTYSALSPYHSTIFITQGTNGTFSWATNYSIEGQPSSPVSSYILTCDTANTNVWSQVAAQSGSQQSIADPGFIHHANIANWRIDALGFTCNPTLRLASGGNNSTMAAKIKSHSNQNNNRQAGIKQLVNASQVNIYPNPNKGSFTIETTATEKQNVQVFDVNGKLVFSQTISGNTSIDAGNLADGVYNVNIMGNEGVVNKRLVIVK